MNTDQTQGQSSVQGVPSAEPAPRHEVAKLASSPLSKGDFRDLTQSWISEQLAREAGLYRVTHEQALEHGIPRIGNGDLSGIMFPNCDPESGKTRGHRLKRDHPELEVRDGTRKLRNKYLSPREQRNFLYAAPGLPSGWMTDPSFPLAIVEGEKKTLAVHSLASHGLGDSAERIRYATLGISGVWSWRGRIGKELDAKGKRVDVYGPISDLDRINWEGRKVTLWPDSNFSTIPAVHAGWTGFAEELKRRGAIVRIASCPNQPGINGPDDALAILGPGWGLNELNKAWQAQEPGTDRTPRAAGAVPTLRAYDCGEFLRLQLHDEQDYIVRTLVPKGGAILLYAIPKSLKTWVVTKLALDAACGRPALGKYDVPAPAKVLLVQIEDREAELQKRLQLIIDSDGGEGPIPGMLQIIPRNPINLGDPQWRNQLEAIIQAQKPQLVILDVMRRFFRGDVNSAKDTAEFLEVLDGIRERHGCAIMLVHHSKKFRQGDMQSNALGSTNLSAWADVLIEIKNKKSKDGVTTAEMEIESKSDPPDEPTTIVLDPRATPMISVQGCASSELTRARASFGDEEWTVKKLAELLKCRDARRHVKRWKDQNLVDELPAAAHGEHVLRFKKADSSPTERTPVENPPTSSAELQPLAQEILRS